MKKSTTIYLIGFAGVGKYTIAKEISKHNYKLVDNHLINNTIFSLLDLDGFTPIKENAWVAIRNVRTAILEFISQDKEANYVFTNELLNEDVDQTIYSQIENTAKARDSIFIPVKLIITCESEHKKRIENPERSARFKENSLPSGRLKKGLIPITHDNLLTLDITDLSPAQAVKEILTFAKSRK